MKRLRALAKINLDLRVLYKRQDGYHELRTIFQTISVADEIAVSYRPAADVSIAIQGAAALGIATEDNLVARAARLVMQEFACGGDLTFALEKRIPMGAGLGGGSSDAASVLLGLPAVIGRSVAPARLHEMAASLGSDVPFFLYGGAAVGLGRGEELYPLPDLPPLAGLLVTPAIHVSTAEAYKAVSVRLGEASPDRKRAEFGQVAWTGDLSQARNDFEEPVFALHPGLAGIRQRLEESGAAVARMTGSGSSIFGLFAEEAALAHAEAALAGHRTIRFSMVSRKQYRDLWAC